ncbi:MAG: rhomboid family intramembrane serine protease [Planctomycetes bacterium]|nr:rhomboid family intramembrane serine protease [Planctomycetota bacterium]
MKCPSCCGKLRRVKSKTALVDICLDCRGIWFDSGEFVDFARSLTESEKISPTKTRLFEPRKVHTLKTVREQTKTCPKCNLAMKRFNYSYDSNIFIDKCLNCQGIWTDGGEIRQVARYLKDDPRIKTIGNDIVEHKKNMEDLKSWAGFGKALGLPVSPFILYMPKIILPLADDNPRERFPVLTTSIITLCVIIFIAQANFIDDLQTFFYFYGFVPKHFLDIGSITSMFLHADVFHLLGNMFFLWIYGDNVEDRFSRLGFIVFYLSCGLTASILHMVFNFNSMVPAVGASGAISGVMGAYLIFYPKARMSILFIYRIIRVNASLYLIMWFIFQLMFALTIFASDSATGIAWFAHIGGFVFGCLVAYYKKRSLQATEESN